MNINKLNYIAILFYFIFILVVCSPSSEVVPIFSNFVFFVLCFFSLISIFYLNFFTYKKELNFIFLPIIFLLAIIAISHIKGMFFYNITTSWNDLSDYLKFFMPLLLLYFSFFLFIKGDNLYRKSILVCVLIYNLFFILFILFGESFVYNLGFGRGEEDYYRYGGFIQNPNRYAGIAFLLFSILICFTNRKNFIFYFPMLVLIYLSIVFSQSRTTIIVSSVVVFCFFVFLKIKLFYKALLTVFCFMIGVFVLNNTELYWLTLDGRFDVASDKSFNTRVNNSINNYIFFSDSIGFFGIGPAKEAVSRLDTIPYIMYYIRYGILGLSSFIFIHISVAIYFFYNFMRFRLKDSHTSKVLLVNTMISFFVLFTNISNERWIDPQLLTLWFVFISYGVVKVYKLNSRIV